MKHKSLGQDLVRALASRKYELTGDGVAFPTLNVEVVGEYFHSVNGGPVTVDKNILTTEFLNYLLMCGLHTLPKVNDWYLTLFAGNVTPATNWKAETFTSAASEIVSSTEGYTQANRVKFNATATNSNQVDNLVGGRAQFTIVTASQLVVRGAALLSDQLKGSTQGLLASASRFTRERTLLDGDTFDLGYRVTLNAV